MNKAEQLAEVKAIVKNFNKRIADLRERSVSTTGYKQGNDLGYASGAEAVLDDLKDVFPDAFE